MIVWDQKEAPTSSGEEVWCWKSYAQGEAVHSIPRYLEEHADRLRDKYHAFIHDLGETEVKRKRLIDHLSIEDSLSYWWLTLLAEQSPLKSPSIIDAIHFLALEEIVVRQRPQKLRLVSANRELNESLKNLCWNLAIPYEWERLADRTQRWVGWRGIYRKLPQPVKALGSLFYYLRVRWVFKRKDKVDWFGGNDVLFFCSYFDVDPKVADQGNFHSYYWGGLQALWHQAGRKSNWLQLYTPVSSPSAAIRWTRGFNQRPEQNGLHAFLDSKLSWRVVLRVLKRWFGLMRTSWRLNGIKHKFCPRGSQSSLWPFMKKDWAASMHGPVAICNLFWIELFDRVIQELPRQKRGLYLCENHSWERILIHAWRKYGHGQLIGVAHTTVCFWHLNYFPDPRTLRSSGPCPMPQPDLLALNGKAAVDTCLNAGFPKEKILECEALRYGYLTNLQGAHSRKPGGSPLKVLILGDCMPSGVSKMLQLLEAAGQQITNGFVYTMKPHPDLPVKAADHPNLHFQITTTPLAKILPDFDIAYASNLTSAAVDAYLVGLPVIAVLDEAELNFSPLRGRPGVSFVSTPGELVEALRTAGQGMTANPDASEFFFLDPKLPRWARLLEN